MSDNNKEEEKKRAGLFPFKFLRGGSKTGLSGLGQGAGVSGFGSGGAAGGFWAGLLATKAGIVGVVLGAATIAAGVGVLYNFLGPSSKPLYSPQLFQDTYYQEQANNASMERAVQRGDPSASTLDMFREQARKDELALGEGGGTEENKEPSADAGAEGGSVDNPEPAAPGADSAVNAPDGGAKLQAAPSLGGSKGGGSSPKLSGGGGMFGGVNGQFAPIYKAPPQGKLVAMKAPGAAAVKNSAKRAVPGANNKGAYGQAKYAGKIGVKAAYGVSDVGVRTNATEAFSGETSGSGEVTTPATGAGIGGSGLSSGNQLRTNDPSLNTNEVTPPNPNSGAASSSNTPTPTDVSPWKKYTNMALYAMLGASVLLVISNMLAKKAKTAGPGAPALYMYAMIAAGLAMAAAAMVIFAGLMLMSKYGQKWTGIMYMMAGAMLMYKAYEALAGAMNDREAAVKSIEDAALKANPTPVPTDTINNLYSTPPDGPPPDTYVA
jgi:hypothetical protein